MKYLKKVTENFDSYVQPAADRPAVIWNGEEKGTANCKCKIFKREQA